MKKLRGFLDEVQAERGRKRLSLSGILVIALLICLLQPSNGFAKYVFDLEWGFEMLHPYMIPFPDAVAINSLGSVYVAVNNGESSEIHKFDADGTYVARWGSLGTGNGQFNYPSGVAVDGSGNVYVADAGNHRIQKFTANGTYLTQLGGFGDGNGQFRYPSGVAVDGSGNVYVLDSGHGLIQKFAASGTYLTQFSSGGALAEGVAVDGSGNVYVLDAGDSTIRKFTASGAYVTQWGSSGRGNGQFMYPGGVAVDSLGNVYVADRGNNRIQKFTATGTYLTQWGGLGSGNGQFFEPEGVAVDSSGNVYVADTLNSRIQKFHYVASQAPPTLGAITPSVVTSVENEAQELSAVYSDGDGYGDLKHTYLRVGSCMNGIEAMYSSWYDRLYLVNDACTGYAGYCTPGEAGTLANSQGTLDCELTTVSGTGNDLTVNWNITPKASFAGAKDLYLFARDDVDLEVGWEDKGDWTITSPSTIAPTLGSISPSVLTSGENEAQEFSVVYSDENGYWDLKHVYLRVGSCMNGIEVLYGSRYNLLYLVNDVCTGYAGYCTPGEAGTLANSQGTLDCELTTVSGTGNDLTVNWRITPNVSFAGTKNLYLFARDDVDLEVGWEDKGDWTITSPSTIAPTLGSISPSVLTSGENEAQEFSVVYSDENDYWDLKHVYLRVGSCMNGIEVLYGSRYNLLYLVNDACTGYAGYCTPGEAGTLANSQGTLDCELTTVSGTGNDLTVNWRITPNVSFAGTKNLYLFARDNGDATVGWEDKGDWTISPPPE